MQYENEIWKDISDYEGLYQISNYGKIKSLSRKAKNKNGYRYTKEKILKNIVAKNGYLKVILYKQGKGKMYLVHRLVAQTFMSNPDNLPQINHKDENKHNNFIDNLEWCTQNYNNKYGTHNKRMQKTKQEKYGKAVKQIKQNGEIVAVYSCIREAYRKTNVGRKEITKVCLKKYKQAGGYRWEYV